MDLGYAAAIVIAPFAVHLIAKWDERDRLKRERAGLPTEAFSAAYRVGRFIRWLAALPKAAHNLLVGRNFRRRSDPSASNDQIAAVRRERRD